MALPRLTATNSLSSTTAGFTAPVCNMPASIVPQKSCFGCMVGAAACGASCLLGPEVCLPCLTGMGLGKCFDCVMSML